MKRLIPACAIAVAAAVLYLAGALEFLEHRLMDLRFRISDRTATGDVAVVSIDPKSLRALDVWPWARGYHATVLENLIGAGAQLVAFDVDFSSRSDPDEDLELSRALAVAEGRVILPVFQQQEKKGIERVLTSTYPLDVFRRHTRLSAIDLRPDSDGLLRRYPLGDGGELGVPSFAAALTGALKGSRDSFYIDFGIDPDTIPSLSYVDVLAGQFDRKLVEGKVVVIGGTAVELNDIVAAPLQSSMPGPYLHALAFESLKQGRALERARPAFTLIVGLLLAFLLAPLMYKASWRQGLGLMFMVCSGSFLVSLAMQQKAALMIDISPWLLVAVGSYSAAMSRKIDQQGITLLLQGMRLQHAQTLMGHVVDSSFDAILTIGTDGRIEMFNAAAEKMFGRRAGEAIGRPIAEMIAPPKGDSAADRDPTEIWRVEGQHEVVGVRSDGTTLPLEIAVSSVTGEHDCHVGILRDISERKAQQRALLHQATHDSLTDLPNRVLLRRRFEKSLREARENGWPVAFLLLDLDGFREINDTLGHHIGDQLLQQIGKRLQGPLRATHSIARLGGDEFAILLPNMGQRGALKMANRLSDCLTEPFKLRKLTLHVSTSVGVSLFPEHGLDSSELIQRADVAMYTAKSRRQGIALYDADQDYNSVRHLTLNGELREAIDNDQLTLFYQPKVVIHSGRITSVEALIRWNHPVHGMMPPDEFIGLAEHTGLIIPLTRWVLGKALGQCLAWRRQGFDISVAVNLSARNLQQKELPYDLEVLLQSCKIPPDCLVVEITESVLMEDPEHSLEILLQLSKLGVHIAIDDFGTGYSSLSYLKKLPANELKIDKSFVMALDSQEDDAVIVRSTIEMAHSLGLKVVAEGVESREVWERLRTFNCDFGQGYHFGRPAPSVELQPQLMGSLGPARISQEPEPVDAAVDTQPVEDTSLVG